jgi:cell division septal protein FtsQ
VTGTSRVDPALIRAAAQISLNSNLWLIDPWSLINRVDAIPYVLSVDLLRALPNRITLAVQERHPESCLLLAGAQVTIDDSQRVLERGCRMAVRYFLSGSKAARPGETVSDPALARLRADVQSLAGERIFAKSASFDRDGGLVVITRDGTRLLLGEDSLLPETSGLIGPILETVRKLGRRVSQIDLRAPATPVVRYRTHPPRSAHDKESRARKGKPRGGA